MDRFWHDSRRLEKSIRSSAPNDQDRPNIQLYLHCMLERLNETLFCIKGGKSFLFYENPNV